jgi:hypothetical protein
MITGATAVRAVQCALDQCRYLTHHIRENDKTVSWDGEIFVYTNTRIPKKKSDLYGVFLSKWKEIIAFLMQI